MKTAKSSLARGHMGGGATGGRGSIYQKKVPQDPGPNTHTAATIRKVLTPPQKKGYPGAGGGGYGGQNPKNHWGIIFGPKMMILQGVRR